MKRNYSVLRLIMVSALVGLAGLTAGAFSVTNSDGIDLTYAINPEDPGTVTLTGPKGACTGVLNIPETVTADDVTYRVVAVDDYAFFGDSGITGVNFPSSVTVIGASAFQSAGLTSLDIPDTVTTIESGAFSGCEDLVTIALGDGLTAIADRVFSDCYALTTLTIGANVGSIGAGAFYGDTSLGSITIYATTPPTLGDGAFMAVPHTCTVNPPDDSVPAYRAAEGWKDFTYAAVTGLDTIGSKRADSPTLYFDLNGRPTALTALTSGSVYVEVRGGESRLVIK